MALSRERWKHLNNGRVLECHARRVIVAKLKEPSSAKGLRLPTATPMVPEELCRQDRERFESYLAGALARCVEEPAIRCKEAPMPSLFDDQRNQIDSSSAVISRR